MKTVLCGCGCGKTRLITTVDYEKGYYKFFNKKHKQDYLEGNAPFIGLNGTKIQVTRCPKCKRIFENGVWVEGEAHATACVFCGHIKEVIL